MSELCIGDRVLSGSGTGDEPASFSEVFAFLDRKPDQDLAYLRMHLSSAEQLDLPAVLFTVSPEHRVFRRGADGELLDVLASELTVGDVLFSPYAADGTTVRANTAGTDLILQRVEILSLRGAYAPVTFAGTLVVDQVLASSYAVTPHDASHLALAPLRLLAQIAPSLVAVQHDGDLHWYAKALYGVFSWFL